MDKLNAAATGLLKIQKPTLEGMGVNVAVTLQSLCWDSPQVDSFFSKPLLARARRSVDTYGLLLIHFQRIAFSEGDGWEVANVGSPDPSAFDCQDVHLPQGRSHVTVHQRAAHERTVCLHNQVDRVSQGSHVGLSAGQDVRGAVPSLSRNGSLSFRLYTRLVELSLQLSYSP
jgi:hypothetical protein